MINVNLLLIDGGTTNTRFTLVRDGQVLERSQRRVGAANADASHVNRPLRLAVGEELRRLEAAHGVRIDQVCISGMITSENGLCMVPHVPAPAGVKELAANIRRVELKDVFDRGAIACIPGIKTQNAAGPDMMRGEETEVMGDLSAHPMAGGRRMYIHFGSHNKAIVTEGGRIVSSCTTMSGELFYAITHDTILASSVGDGQDYAMDEAWVKRGFACASDYGMSRALFAARMGGVLEGASAAQVRSFLYGVLIQQDMAAFSPLLEAGAEEVVLYGRRECVDACLCCAAKRFKNASLRTISFEDSEWLSVIGIQRILNEAEGMSEHE